MKGKKCWKCKFWVKYYNSNQYFVSVDIVETDICERKGGT